MLRRMMMASASGGGGVDPHWGNVVALLHMDGADGATTFTDQKGKVWTGTGAAQLDTAIVKYGSAAALLATPGHITTPSSEDFALGTGDFTVEGWVYLTDVANNCPLASCADASSGNTNGWTLYARHNGSGNVLRFFNPAVGGTTVNGATVVTLSTWHHVAAARESGILRLFLDGVLDGSASVATNFSDQAQMKIGGARGPSPGDFIRGSVDEFRVTKGVARYTASFTPPLGPFPNS